jgi:phenylacetate-CoA ligase
MTPLRLARSALLFAEAMHQRRVPYFPTDRIQDIQQERLRRMVRHAYETVPYYSRTMRSLGVGPEDFRTAEDLARLPLVDRKTVSECPLDFRSRQFDPETCVALESGSGTVTYWDRESTLRRLVYLERDRVAWLKAGRIGLRHKQLHLLSYSSSTLISRRFWESKVGMPRFLVERHYLDPVEPYEKAVEALERIRPEVVFSYGSYLEQFARFLRDRGVSPPMPRVWVYGADSISEHWRSLIEREFGCQVLSVYSSTEADRIGFECERRSGHHLNIDLCAVRFLKEDGSDAAPGETGEVVISGLVNRATVLFNYRLGDLAEPGGNKCACGRSLPLMRRFQGRVSEVVQLADGRKLPSTVLLGKFDNEIVGALKVQVVSPRPGHIVWTIVPGGSLDREQYRLRLLARCRDVFRDQAEVSVQFVSDIAPTQAGKFRAVIQSTEPGT